MPMHYLGRKPVYMKFIGAMVSEFQTKMKNNTDVCLPACIVSYYHPLFSYSFTHSPH